MAGALRIDAFRLLRAPFAGADRKEGRMSDAIPRDVPFSLSCTECDCDSPDSYEEALSDGWTQIEYYPEGSSENFLGLCPDCRREEEQK